MNVKKQLTCIFVCIATMVATQVTAEILVSVDTLDDQGYGCLVIYNGQGYRVGWTQTNNYKAVVVSAKLGSGGAANQTGQAYLTTQIGAGTTTNHLIASSSFTFPLEVTNVVFFSGLQLVPGAYYLSIIGDSSSWGSCWKMGFATNVITGVDVTTLGGFGSPGGLTSFFPSAPAYAGDTNIPPEFTVQGVNVDYPTLEISQSSNVVSVSWSTNVAGFNLESASNLSFANLQVISQGLATNMGRFVFTTNADGVRFFRLRKATN